MGEKSVSQSLAPNSSASDEGTLIHRFQVLCYKLTVVYPADANYIIEPRNTDELMSAIGARVGRKRQQLSE
jgi:hypothetical protein